MSEQQDYKISINNDIPIQLATWYSYPSIFNLGHKAIQDLLLDEVLVEEKIDGSQISFGKFEDGYRCRSKGAQLNIFAPEKMFSTAVTFIQTLPLKEGWTYRAEYILKPKHNVLVYDRIPKNNLIIFDIVRGYEDYLSYNEKVEEADRLGLEVVPRLYEGKVDSAEKFRELLDTVSILGGQKVEGVVVKNYKRFQAEKKVMLGKFVSEAFKEVHSKVWKADNPTQGDIIERLIQEYHSQARWQKAIQHLREAGKLTNELKDIGLLIQEVPDDILKECEDEIKEKLFTWAWPKMRRGVIAGLPQFYKEKLMEAQFNNESAGSSDGRTSALQAEGSLDRDQPGAP